MNTFLASALATALFSQADGPFLRRLAEVESGGNPVAVGKIGERGIYQFRKSTWESVTTKHFSHAFQPRAATHVAMFQMGRLIEEFYFNTERPPTAPELYILWNMGLSGFQKRGFDLKKCPASVQKNAARFEGITLP